MDTKFLKRFYELLAGYRGTYVILYLTKLGTLLFSSLLPIILSVFIDEVLYHHQTSQIMEITLLYIFVFLLYIFFSACDIVIWQYLSNYLVISIKEKLWKKILNLKMSVFNNYSQADFIQIINDDARAFVRLINQNILPFINAIASALISIGLIFSISIFIGIIVIITVPISVLLSKRWLNNLNALAKKERNINVQIVSYLLDISRKLRDIHLLNAQNYFSQKVESSNDSYLETGKELAVGQTIAEEKVKLFEGITRILIFIVVSFASFQGKLSIGQYIAMSLYIDAAHKAITTILNFNFQLAQRNVNLSKVFDLLEQDEECIKKGSLLNISNGTITASNVSFGYSEDQLIINNLSFTALRGNLTGIIGRNGSGKSTLISILLGLYCTYTGTISIDGLELREISLESLRNNFYVVLQKEHWNNVTVSEYICLNSKINKEDILININRYSFCDFLIEDPNLLNSPMENLSGGQMQRISIMAAFLSSSPILIFDEPTSMVDDKLEKEIFQILLQEKNNRTILVVTHGDQYLKYYDHLICMGKE